MKKHLKIRILKKLGILKSFNLTGSLHLGSKKMIIPVNKGVGFTNLFMKESWMLDLFKELLGKVEGDFLDIGMNIGQTIMKIRSLNDEIRIIGFEPNPNCLSYLYDLIRLNDFKNVEIVPSAAGSSNALLKLNMYHDNVDESATIIENFRGQTINNSINVMLSDISYILTHLNSNPGFIKIDVEGAELEVIQSLKFVLRDNRPLVICEILPVYDKMKQKDRFDRQTTIQAELEKAGYLIFQILEGKIEELPEFEVHSDMALTNYLFVPKEKRTLIENLETNKEIPDTAK